MKLNFDAVISAGYDLCSSLYTWHHNYPGHHDFRYVSDDNRNAHGVYHALKEHSRALDAICEVLGISAETVIRAVRAENKYYSRGGQRYLDAERLIRGLE